MYVGFQVPALFLSSNLLGKERFLRRGYFYSQLQNLHSLHCLIHVHSNVGTVQALAGTALEVVPTAEQFKHLGFTAVGNPFQECWIEARI